MTGSAFFPGGLGEFDHPQGEPDVRGRPDHRRAAPVGDVLRRGRPGWPVAAVRRHPHPDRRLRRSTDRLHLWQVGLGARHPVLRRDRAHSLTTRGSAPRRAIALQCPGMRRVRAAPQPGSGVAVGSTMRDRSGDTTACLALLRPVALVAPAVTVAQSRHGPDAALRGGDPQVGHQARLRGRLPVLHRRWRRGVRL